MLKKWGYVKVKSVSHAHQEDLSLAITWHSSCRWRSLQVHVFATVRVHNGSWQWWHLDYKDEDEEEELTEESGRESEEGSKASTSKLA